MEPVFSRQLSNIARVASIVLVLVHGTHEPPLSATLDPHSEHRFPAPSSKGRNDVVNQCLEFALDLAEGYGDLLASKAHKCEDVHTILNMSLADTAHDIIASKTPECNYLIMITNYFYIVGQYRHMICLLALCPNVAQVSKTHICNYVDIMTNYANTNTNYYNRINKCFLTIGSVGLLASQAYDQLYLCTHNCSMCILCCFQRLICVRSTQLQLYVTDNDR